jgi:hypothetical protein
MKSISILAVAASLAVLPLAANAQIAQPQNSAGPASQNQPATPTNKPIVQGAKENAAEAGRAMKQSGSEISQGVKKGAHEVADGAKKGTTAVKRRVAVAKCNDGAFSYTRTNTCSDHGGIAERLKK